MELDTGLLMRFVAPDFDCHVQEMCRDVVAGHANVHHTAIETLLCGEVR